MNYLRKLYGKLPARVQDKKGATMVEYALMVALIAVVAMAAVGTIGSNVNTKFTAVGTKLATP